ncbi:hypothetical protein EV195_108113 [Tenacibaculum skagerrakense]|uniref:Uncharacterized protein n=1 Tax=Tenacibaculum skagerrakense TaxID=186571 RepID=A0A4R2NPA9_9FLAO|nr:hypothetical protein [Tenacibaculum skagerrakense]TCP23643.1 hypothetical protein EV195_108113 [Tenacibaculum skagerrakense]
MFYQEIENLKADLEKHIIKISNPFDHIRKDLFFVTLSINGNSWKLLIEDEYDDFSETNTLMNWFLVLYNLESYEEAKDIMEWANEINVNPKDFLDYYRDLGTAYKEIEHQLGKIDAQISSYDYTLRTGVAKALANETSS